jgi:general secretion pathway protein J
MRHPTVPRRPAAPGFTLLEVVVALAIVGALLLIAFSGMRVALAAWQQGETRAEAHQHARGIGLTLTRAVGATHPYRASRGLAPQPELLFAGTAKRLEFVTAAPPFPLAAPIAFTAVVIALEEGERPGLVVRERALPNRDPFAEAAIVFHDPTVTALEVRYMDEGGQWQDSWDGAGLKSLPRAVRLTVSLGEGRPLPALTVALRTPVP